MATLESEKRMERRRNQLWWARLNDDAEIQEIRRRFAAKCRYRQRHPFSGAPLELLWMHSLLPTPDTLDQGLRPAA
jgi:hypothetical protein